MTRTQLLLVGANSVLARKKKAEELTRTQALLATAKNVLARKRA
jgi:hypothetical protein